MIAVTRVLVVLMLLATAASAAPKTAREFYQSATSHYNLSEWQSALDDFREAYRLKPDSAFLFNIAQCHRQLGHYREAANFYRAYRREGGTNDVEHLITEMDDAAQKQRDREEAADREKAANTPPTAVQPPATTPSQPSTLVATAPARDERPLIKKPWFWAVVGGGAVVLATGVTLAVVYGTPPKDPKLTFGMVQGN